MNKNLKKMLFFLLPVIFCSVTSAHLYSAAEIISVPAEEKDKEFRLESRFMVVYPAYFDILEPELFQGLIPNEQENTLKMKLILFSLNRVGGEPKLTIVKSEYDVKVDLASFIGNIDYGVELQGGIQKTEILDITDNSAEIMSSAITYEGDIFKSRSKIFLFKDLKKNKTFVYQISVGASFNNYYKYLAVIDSIIKSAEIVESGGGSNGGK